MLFILATMGALMLASAFAALARHAEAERAVGLGYAAAVAGCVGAAALGELALVNMGAFAALQAAGVLAAERRLAELERPLRVSATPRAPA